MGDDARWGPVQNAPGNPVVIDKAMSAAATKSTAAQNDGHQRVPATNWVRCCQTSLTPWAASPATTSHAVPVTAAAATTTNAATTVASTASTCHRPSATAKPM